MGTGRSRTSNTPLSSTRRACLSRLGDTPERVPALRVPAEFFPLFGVTPAAGRTFTREAEQPGRGDVILIAYDVWQRRLNGAADAIGRSIAVEGRPATIIGILPKGFSFTVGDRRGRADDARD